jgi:SAM-dependent methyltransferase
MAAYGIRPMPTIEENRAIFERYEWPRGGDEWSEKWGSSRLFFYGTVMPRIAARVPTDHMLEIAPGYGRLTQFLLRLCDRYTGVDIADNCVRACRERFSDAAHAQFVLGDGRSLGFLEDASIDFAFSFDSLVHADEVALTGYVRDLEAKLRPGAYAFLHHSNLGEYVSGASGGAPTVPNPEFRDPTVSAESFRQLSESAGLDCIAQEIINWHSPHYTDCITLCRRPAGTVEPSAETVVARHPDMAIEEAAFKRLHEIYER